ncbi:MAG: hypothetical protein ACUVT9_05415 [Candidatus Bathycorpusculaceae bacterium]
MKGFHVYSDRKTVKELSWADYMKMSGKKGYLCGWVDDTDILFIEGDSIIFLSLEQLNKILELNEKESET